MHPAQEALLFLLDEAKKRAIDPATHAKAAALFAKLKVELAPDAPAAKAPAPVVVKAAEPTPLASLISSVGASLGAAPAKAVDAK
jgi:hypothetical protein